MPIAFFHKATAKNPQLQGQQMVNHNEDTDRYQLNSNDFLRRLGLEVSEEVLAYLQGISDRTGRSIMKALPPSLTRVPNNLILNSLIFEHKCSSFNG